VKKNVCANGGTVNRKEKKNFYEAWRNEKKKKYTLAKRV
jgi:hypothetical protein